MPLMAWNQEFSVGVAPLDEEHQRLVALLNDFYDALQTEKANDVVGEILDRLIQYAELHFGHEEKYLRESGYADYPAHKKLHDDLTRQVLAVQQKSRSDGTKSDATNALSVQVMSFLNNWLLNHIQGTDRKYGPHLNSKGIY